MVLFILLVVIVKGTVGFLAFCNCAVGSVESAFGVAFGVVWFWLLCSLEVKCLLMVSGSECLDHMLSSSECFSLLGVLYSELGE